MNPKIDRADKVLVALGHFESRAAAQAAIAVGRVKVNGHILKKASEKIANSSRIEAVAAHPWVSRGGVKLEDALRFFVLDVAGFHCLDIGASTGGFTDVLLSRGAASVVAVDVGRDQMHERLRSDARVTVLEAKDARDLTLADIGRPPQLIVCDASFISLSKLLATPLSLGATNAQLVTLFKPQFEVGRENVGKGGIVKDRVATQDAEDRFAEWLAAQGWTVRGRVLSSIKGSDGNEERLIWAVRD